MLQRIQSIYLSLASLVLFSLFLFPLVHHVNVGGEMATIKVTGVLNEQNGQLQPTQTFTALSVATIIVGILPLFVIFLYRNRKQQIAFCYATILVIIGYSFWMAQTVKGVTGGVVMNTNNFGIGVLLSSISIFLMIFAVKAIQRDEKLVKSADRLR